MIRRNIPNLITLGNLLCGCLALISAFAGNLDTAAYLVGIALVLDFFDGFAARLLGVSSPIGKDLDSLADMVTFGVVPGIVMYQLIAYFCIPFIDGPNDIGGELNHHTFIDIYAFAPYLKYVALIIPLISAVRLARFNNDTRQTESFIGMPTPANAMVICSLPLILHANKVVGMGGGSKRIIRPVFYFCRSAAIGYCRNHPEFFTCCANSIVCLKIQVICCKRQSAPLWIFGNISCSFGDTASGGNPADYSALYLAEHCE